MAAPGCDRLPVARRTGSRFAGDSSGSVTLWNLFWLINFFVLVGVAVDTSNAWRMRAIMLSTADAAAHAAVVAMIDAGVAGSTLAGLPALEGIDGSDPREVARAVAGANMPPSLHGQVLRTEDVELGHWDGTRKAFEPDALSPDAARVTVRRTTGQANGLQTFLLRMAGFPEWSIEVASVARYYRSPRGPCIEPLLAAQARVDVQRNDVYVGLCVYADADAALAPGGAWLDDRVIALVDRLVLSGATSAVTGTGLNLASLEGLPLDLSAGLTTAEFRAMIADLRASADLVLDAQSLREITLAAGMTYFVECTTDQALPLPAGLTLAGVVLISECPVRAGQHLVLDSSILITNLRALRDPTLDPIVGLPPPEITVDAPCDPADGVQVLVFVDFETAARFEMLDPVLYPLGESLVAAHRDGRQVDGTLLASIGVSLVGDLAAALNLDGLLGVCLGAQYMLHADAVTLAR